MSNKYSRVVENIPPSGIRKFFDLVASSSDIISLGVGEPDFVTPWHVREEAYHSLEQGKTCYTSNNGLLPLRSKISEYLSKRFNCSYDPGNEILITVGVSEGIDIILRALLNPGDEVIIPEPCYVSYAPLIILAGGIPVPVDTSASLFKVTATAIENKITPKTKAIFISYPNNPTGCTIDHAEINNIALLAKKHDVWVLSDEVYAELTYSQDHLSIASLPGLKDNVILFNGFSKAFAMTGWRLGYICGPAKAIALAVKIHQYAMLCAPITSQYAAIEALDNCSRDIQFMKKSYEQRRNLFVEGLKEIGLAARMPDGAFYAFPSIKDTGLSSEDFALRAISEAKVAVVPGNAFGQCGEGYIRCCYATDIKLIKEALVRLKKFLKNL